MECCVKQFQSGQVQGHDYEIQQGCTEIRVNKFTPNLNQGETQIWSAPNEPS